MVFMMVATRKGKRNRSFNGSRNHGKGNAKNGRGKGNKGGWGRAGMHKHRFSYMTRFERDKMAHGGRFGFSSLNMHKLPTVNLYEIEQLAQGGKLERRAGKATFEFEGKVLGTGTIKLPVSVKAYAFSEGAMAKIKKAGGSTETFGAASAPEEKKE